MPFRRSGPPRKRTSAPSFLFVAIAVGLASAAPPPPCATEEDHFADPAACPLSALSDAVLEKMCTNRGMEIIPYAEYAAAAGDGGGGDATGEYSHEDYVVAAQQCINMDAEIDAILAENPDIAKQMEEELRQKETVKEGSPLVTSATAEERPPEENTEETEETEETEKTEEGGETEETEAPPETEKPSEITDASPPETPSPEENDAAAPPEASAAAEPAAPGSVLNPASLTLPALWDGLRRQMRADAIKVGRYVLPSKRVRTVLARGGGAAGKGWKRAWRALVPAAARERVDVAGRRAGAVYRATVPEFLRSRIRRAVGALGRGIGEIVADIEAAREGEVEVEKGYVLPQAH